MAKVGNENKPHIGIYGRCNSGKSTFLNFITGGQNALVSEIAGTTTDPVRKAYEILGFAPVVFIDTAGIDDDSALGDKRREKTLQTLILVDLGVIVFNEWGGAEEEIVEMLNSQGTPFVLVHNIIAGKSVAKETLNFLSEKYSSFISADLVNGDDSLRDLILGVVKGNLPESSYVMPSMFEGRAGENDIVMLVCPIDGEAPSGRLILPQVQAIRALLDKNAVAVMVQPPQIPAVIKSGIKPSLVVTDSQAFAEVSRVIPQGIEITSFSILLAQLKGDYASYSEGLEKIGGLKDGDGVLILENCLHQTSCEDIGRVKIPRMLSDSTGKNLEFTVISGLSPLPDDLSEYSLAVQCGGCMVTRTQLQNRIRAVRKAGVPITNYGMMLKRLSLKG